MLCSAQNGLSELLQASYTFAVVKTDSQLLSSYTFCGYQHRLSQFLLASYTLCGYQNGLSKILLASYMFCGVQNRLSKLLQLSYMLEKRYLWTSTNLIHSLRCSKGTNLYRLWAAWLSYGPQLPYSLLLPTSRFSKRTLSTFTSLLHALWCSKRTVPTSTSFLHG